VKPEINMGKLYILKKGMIIDCTLKRSNPPEVKFTWYSCNTPTCGEKSQSLTKKSILQLDSQPKSVMKYKCKAKNAAGSASEIIEVFKSAENISKSTKSKLHINLFAKQPPKPPIRTKIYIS
jgi:hypothetical protein